MFGIGHLEIIRAAFKTHVTLFYCVRVIYML